MKKDIKKDRILNSSETTKTDSPLSEVAKSEQVSNATSQEVTASQTVNSKETVKGSVFLNRGEPDESDTARQPAKPTGPADNIVHAASNPLHMITPTTVQQRQAAKEQQDLNEIVHRMLIVGLVISTTLMLIGLGLDLVLGRKVSTTALGLAEAIRRILVFRPSGFLTMGLLVLIATPILRVVGSIATFVYERDWRYALITLLVLIIVMISLVSGNG